MTFHNFAGRTIDLEEMTRKLMLYQALHPTRRWSRLRRKVEGTAEEAGDFVLAWSPSCETWPLRRARVTHIKHISKAHFSLTVLESPWSTWYAVWCGHQEWDLDQLSLYQQVLIQNSESNNGDALNMFKSAVPKLYTFMKAIDPSASIACKCLANNTPFLISLIPEIGDGEL